MKGPPHLTSPRSAAGADKGEDATVDDAPEATAVDVASATEATLVDMVIGVPGIASHVLAASGILELGRLSPVALAQRADVALTDATRLAAAFELGRRLQAARARRPKRLRSARDTALFFHPRLAPLVHEEVWIAALDAWGGVRGTRMIARGGLGGALVRTTDVLRAALEMAAVTFVMAHNHPSGNPTPSVEDVELTNAVEHAALLIGMEMTHHVVLTPSERWASIMNQVRKPLW